MFSINKFNPIPDQVSGVPFMVSGTISLYPSLNFSDDGSHFTEAPSGCATPYGVVEWSFEHPALGVSESGTITIQEGTMLGIVQQAVEVT